MFQSCIQPNKMETRILALAILTFIIEQSHVEAQPVIDQQLSSENKINNNNNNLGDGRVSTSEPALYKQDSRRPIWSLAHMINSIKELEYKLRKGANGVEADVTFSSDGVPLYTYHGPPCDCWRHCNQQDDFEKYLKFIREVSIDTPIGLGQNLSMLILDLKLNPLDQRAKERAGQELAKSIMNNLFLKKNQQAIQSRPFHLIISINHVNDVDLVRNFIHTLEMNDSGYLLAKNIGFDVGMNDDLQLIESMWRKLSNDLNLNLWQGDGITNCLSPFFKLNRLSKALAKRDNPDGYPDKVYHWTIDLHDKMYESLLLGVDAIMTNHPERIITVLQDPMLAHDLRLASRQDNPFQKLARGSTARSGEMARYQRSAHVPIKSGFFRRLVDVLDSCYNYIKEIPYLSYATTIGSRSSSKSAKPQPIVAAAIYTGGNVLTDVTQVKLQNEPEYKVLANATNSNATQERQSESQATNNGLVPNQDTNLEYEGPKWYTSLLSSMLVSALRVLLPDK